MADKGKKKLNKNLLKIMIMIFMFCVLGIGIFKNNNLKKFKNSTKDIKYSSTSLDKNLLISKKFKSIDDLEIIIGGNLEIDNKLKKIENNINYFESFKEVSHIFKESLTIFNLRSPLNKYNKSHNNLSSSLKKIGVSIINTDINNVFKQDNKTLFETLDILKNNNLKVLGLKDNLIDKDYLIFEKKGIKIGVLSYNLWNSRKKLNLEEHISLLDISNVEQCKSTIENHICKLKKDLNVDFLISIVNPNDVSFEDVKKINKILYEKNINLIINYDGKKDFINIDKENNKLTVSNNSAFLHSSNLCSEKKFINTYMFKVNLFKDKDNIVKLKNIECIPLAIYKNKENFKVIPLVDKQIYRNLNVNLKDIRILEERKKQTLKNFEKLIQ